MSTENTKPTEENASPTAANGSRRRMIFTSVFDDRLKGRYKGYIVDLSAKGNKTLVAVYGETMGEMRRLKHHLAEAVRNFYAND